MLCHSTRDIALLARVFKNSKCFLPSRQTSKKSDKAEKLRRMRSEDKLFFGKLVETKKEKEKRLKLETSGKIGKNVPSTVDSEFAWMLGSSKLVAPFNPKSEKVTPILQQNERNYTESNQICDTEQVPNYTESNQICDAEQVPMPETTAKSKTSVKIEVTDENSNSILSTEETKKKEILLSKEILQNLLQFPVFDTGKSSNDEWTHNSKIMTVSPMKDRDCLKYPSVTKILTATMSEEAKAVLEKWKQRMIEKFGFRGFELYQKELLEEGKSLHSTIMNKLSGKPYEVPSNVKQAYNSLNKVFEDVDSVRALESHVIHPTLMYRGIVDCVAVYRGNLCLIDWKKSDKIKENIKTTYDAPLQLASYIGALNADVKYPFQIKKGIIIVAYTTGKPANVHEINEEELQKYWKLWLQRLQDYHVILNPT